MIVGGSGSVVMIVGGFASVVECWCILFGG
jgi:hypothetical protein